MKKQESLSDKIIDGKDKSIRYSDIVRLEDIKEFIKRLKKEFGRTDHYTHTIIDKLAGEKLTK